MTVTPAPNRRFPQKLVPGVVFPTKFIYTNAVHYTDCPKCGAVAEFYCVTPAGRHADPPHVERTKAYRLGPDAATAAEAYVAKVETLLRKEPKNE